LEPESPGGASRPAANGRSGDEQRVHDEAEDTPHARRLPPILVPASLPNATGWDRRDRRETPVGTVRPAALLRDRATLTVLSGEEPGRVLALQPGETILGRSSRATISVDDPLISRHHARVARTESGRYLLEDLGSKNGTFVNGRTASRVPLRSGDRVQLGPGLVFQFALVDEREETLHRRLYESSTRDSLTGLTNRRSLLDRLELEIARGREDGSDTGMLMIDVDHFKEINDRFGHLAGDEVLRALAASAARMFRAGDLFARYGGEEFVAVICSATKGDLVALAERLRASIAAMQVEIGAGAVSATVSVGVALWSECTSERAPGDSLALVALADDRMYAAKRSGRNSVCSDAASRGVRRT
jgi:two-component system, cell cycle response regulator